MLKRQFNLRLSLHRHDCTRVAGSLQQTVLTEMTVALGHHNAGVTQYLLHLIETAAGVDQKAGK